MGLGEAGAACRGTISPASSPEWPAGVRDLSLPLDLPKRLAGCVCEKQGEEKSA